MKITFLFFGPCFLLIRSTYCSDLKSLTLSSFALSFKHSLKPAFAFKTKSCFEEAANIGQICSNFKSRLQMQKSKIQLEN